MRKTKVIRGIMFSLAKEGEVFDLYTMEEVEAYPNISDLELHECQAIYEIEMKEIEMMGNHKYSFVGFAKERDYTDEDPKFIQVYASEVEFID